MNASDTLQNPEQANAPSAAPGRPPSPARLAAFRALVRLEQTGFNAHLEDVLHEICDTTGVTARDRKLAYEITSGCIRHRTWLDQFLDQHASRRSATLDPPLRWILLVGLYQILFLDRVTPYAAVNECVLLCRHQNNRGWMSFANGVLRTVVRERAQKDFVRPVYDQPAIQFAHPQWLIDEYTAMFGAEHVPAALAWNNSVPQRYVRVRCGVEELKAEMDGGIIAPAPEFGPSIVRVLDMAALIASSAFAAGRVYIMQPWSVRVAGRMPLQAGMRVLDMCAAPGGKSIAMADAADVKIAALDVTPARLALIEGNAKRSGVTTIETRVLDARSCAATLGEATFDAVLLDAPCTNLGVIRRHPEIKWRVQPGMVASVAQQQRDLLREGAKCVKPGGHLLYAVCTVSREETTGVLEMAQRELPWLALKEHELTGPGQNNMDGGFWALFYRP